MQVMEIDILVDHPSLTAPENAILQAIRLAIHALQPNFPDGDLSIAILSDPAVAELHGDFLDDPSTTDVITFPGDPDMEFAGEICVSADRALATHSEHGTCFAEELTLYLMHGLLHLSGYDDTTDAASERMREGEAMLMQLLHESAAIPCFVMQS